METENIKNIIRINFPYESNFIFHDFEDFSRDHNLITWKEFIDLENLILLDEMYVDTNKLKNVLNGLMFQELNSKISPIIIFKLKTKFKLNKGWFVLDSIVEENLDKTHFKLWNSQIIEKKMKKGVKEWITCMLKF